MLNHTLKLEWLSLLVLFLLPFISCHDEEEDDEDELNIKGTTIMSCIFVILTVLIIITILFEHIQTIIFESGEK